LQSKLANETKRNSQIKEVPTLVTSQMSRIALSWQNNWQSSSLTGQLKPALNSQHISTKVEIFILDPFHLVEA